MKPKAQRVEWLREVGRYYDETNELWSRNMGSTIQAGIITQGSSPVDIFAHNVFLAHRAGIKQGDNVLDAGCGVCGPAIDIARAFKDVTIEAITISERQVHTARRMLSDSGLLERIGVRLGDYHDLPYRDHTFDVVQYLESSSHSPDADVLFSEAFRVLRPGGILYVKDGFLLENPTDQQFEDSRHMDQRFHMQTRTLAKATSTIRGIGFEISQVNTLTDRVNASYFSKAMLQDPAEPTGPLTPLGLHHYREGERIMAFNWPVIGEIKATKPI